MVRAIDILLVSLAVAGAATYLFLRWRRKRKKTSQGCGGTCGCAGALKLKE